MKLLVGVPVFRLPDLVERTLKPIVTTPATVLVVDNGADKDVKERLKQFSTVHLIENANNRYCNGAWNQIMEYSLGKDFDVVGLQTDATLFPGWYETLERRFLAYKDEVWLPNVDGRSGQTGVQYLYGGVPGVCQFLPMEAVQHVFPIPPHVRHWYGDQYMFETLRSWGWKITVLREMPAQHEWTAVTGATPEAYKVIAQDKLGWERLAQEKK